MDMVAHRFHQETVNIELVGGQRHTGYVNTVSETFIELVIPGTGKQVWVFPWSSIIVLDYIPEEHALNVRE